MSLAILQTVKRLYGGKLELHPEYFDTVMGTSTVREAFERGEPFEKIGAGLAAGLAEFAKLRSAYLRYQ